MFSKVTLPGNYVSHKCIVKKIVRARARMRRIRKAILSRNLRRNDAFHIKSLFSKLRPRKAILRRNLSRNDAFYIKSLFSKLRPRTNPLMSRVRHPLLAILWISAITSIISDN